MSLKPFLQFQKFCINKEQRLGLDFQAIVANSPERGYMDALHVKKSSAGLLKAGERFW